MQVILLICLELLLRVLGGQLQEQLQPGANPFVAGGAQLQRGSHLIVKRGAATGLFVVFTPPDCCCSLQVH